MEGSLPRGSPLVSFYLAFDINTLWFGWFLKHPERLGGVGKVVEVDETCISRRKYNVGRSVDQQCTGKFKPFSECLFEFEGIERDGNQCFIEPVSKRDSETLNAVIQVSVYANLPELFTFVQKYIVPGTATMTDGWAGYNSVTDLPEGYEHYAVNHSKNFVDPEDPDIHTQNIESMHQKFKHRHKKEYGTARLKLVSYMKSSCGVVCSVATIVSITSGTRSVNLMILCANSCIVCQ